MYCGADWVSEEGVASGFDDVGSERNSWCCARYVPSLCRQVPRTLLCSTSPLFKHSLWVQLTTAQLTVLVGSWIWTHEPCILAPCKFRGVMTLDSFVDFGAMYIVCIICFPTYPFFFICFLTYLLPYSSFPSRIDPLCFQAGGHKRQPYLGCLVVLIYFMLFVFLCFWYMIICSVS